MLTLRYVVNDTRPEMVLELQQDNVPLPGLATATSVQIVLKKGASAADVVRSLTIFDAAAGIVRGYWGTGDLDAAGRFFADIKVTFADGRVQTSEDAVLIVVRAANAEVS